MIKEKDKVRLRYWRERIGMVVRVGPEVSEVRFDNGIFFYANEQLENVNEPARKEKTLWHTLFAKGKGAVQRLAKKR